MSSFGRVDGIDGVDGIGCIDGIHGIDDNGVGAIVIQDEFNVGINNGTVQNLDANFVHVSNVNMVSYTSRLRKQLRDKINKLSQTEHEEIFKMLLHDQENINFTQNNNGVFFDISLFNDTVMTRIERFVEFCTNNKIELDKYDKHMNECKIRNCYDRHTNSNNNNNETSYSSSVPLTNAISSQVCVDNWQGLIQETKTNEKITAFVSLLENNSEKLCIKRANTKFINAKKRYSKKTITERKNEGDLQNNMTRQEYDSAFLYNI